MTWLKSKLFIFASLGGLGLLTIFYLVRGGLSSGDISLNISKPDKAPRPGEPVELKVDFTNNSRNVMKDVRLGLKFPEGAVPFSGENLTIETREIGDIKPGGLHQELFKIVLTPRESRVREFVVTASYSPESLIARFEKSRSLSLDAEETNLTLDLKAPEKVFSGEEIDISIQYQKSESDPLNYELKVEYPAEFTLVSGNPAPTVSNNIWKLSDKEGKISLRGRVELPDETNFSVKANLTSKILGKEYVFISKALDLKIAPSPLNLKIFLEDLSRDVYYPAEMLNYILSFKNNTPVELKNLVLKAQLIGVMFNFPSLKSEGTFNNINNTITWYAKNVGNLVSLLPGESRNINFSIILKNDYPIRRLSDKNFVLKVKARLESPTVPYLISADKTVSTALLETKVGGKINAETKGYFRDAASGILNAGPFPPKVGWGTEFTVHLLLTNFSTDLTDIEVRVPLESGVVFTGKVKGNTTTLPELSGTEVVWRIDRLFATAGITSDHPVATFQIRATPQSHHLGGYFPLLGITKVKAHDEFTGLDIVSSYNPLTTRLPDDGTVTEKDGIVIQ